MQEGTITKISDRGFGFIRRRGGADVYFHCTALPDTLPFDGRLLELRVTFDTKREPKGERAYNIQPASDLTE